MIRLLPLWVLLVLSSAACADSLPQRPVCELGDLTKLTNWSGLQGGKAGATLSTPGAATFRYPDGPRGRYSVGFTSENDSTRDWSNWYGVRFDVNLGDERPLTLQIAISGPDAATDHGTTAQTTLRGAGWHTVLLPWSSFDFPQEFAGVLRDVKQLTISAKFDDGTTGVVGIRNVCVVHGRSVWLDSIQRGRSVDAGGTANYTVTVGNCSDEPQVISLSFERQGFEAMTSTVSPATVKLDPNAVAQVQVSVAVPDRVPPGGSETQTLIAVGGDAQLELLTAAELPHPYIMLTSEGWDQVRAKVKKYDWAKSAADDYITQADRWHVPPMARNGKWLVGSVYVPESDLLSAGISYQLTFDKKYAQKARTFLLALSDPQNGYPRTHQACNQASVQEGEFFQRVAMAYDLTIPSGIYSDADRAQIDQTLRLFIAPPLTSTGGISNWTVSWLCGSLFCALDLQDLSLADQLLNGPTGILDQLRQGVLDDGWWYERSISYNMWVATEFSQVAIAMRPWGVDLANTSFPSAYRPNDVKPPQDEEYGMSRARWGPIYHNSINIKRMWDALPPMVDWHGVIFGLNDSGEKSIIGTQMDIAYYLYRDPAYATLIKRGGGSTGLTTGKRDLLYGVPELPENTPDLSLSSAFADNVGVAVLRSQTPSFPPRDRIEAVLHYSDHGWYHGHFDETDLVHLSRYGRSFYNPEMIWYSYPNFMYKFYVQTSLNHNMVVVDQKQQEPTECQRLLFHTGPMMQAAAVQTKARWSNPPYGGMFYPDQPYKTLADKAFAEGRSLPIPDNAPKYGQVTGYTEPILQRRLIIVTDDYVVVADYLKGEQEHTFDQLFQMRGFQGLEGPGKELIKHTGQWNPDALSSAQFVTDCDWYNVQAPARGSYHFQWGPPGDKSGAMTGENINGVLNMDLHTLWPPKEEIMIGTAPEAQPVNRQVSYAVRGDGKTLAEGKSGMWILGQVNIDQPLDGANSLELETQTPATKPGTLFWAGGSMITGDGKEIPLAQFPVTVENTMQPKEPGKDFGGGPIKIAGIQYDAAISAQPQDGKKPAIARVDLSGVHAARFKCVLGGDFPVGDESGEHKLVAERSVGKEASFLTVIEPFEDKRMIKTAAATGPDTLRVELADGRVQEIKIEGLSTFTPDMNVAVNVHITETKPDGSTRKEDARSADE